MGRVVGAIAIFGGWLCIPLGAFAGLAYSSFFGLTFVPGAVSDAPPPSGVYGIGGTVVLIVFGGAALLAAVPAGSAMFARDPRRPLKFGAAAMASVGVLLLGDPLGRAFGVPLIAGAALFIFGGWVINRGATAIEPGGEPPDLWSIFDADRVAAPASGERAELATDIPPKASAAAGEAAAAGAATPSLPRLRKRRRSTKLAQPECSWCSAPVSASAEVCPNCHAALDIRAVVDAMAIPGVTEVTAALQDYDRQSHAHRKRRGLMSLLAGPSWDDVAPPRDVEREALKPPSSEVRAEMARISREIAAGAEREPAAPEPEPAAPEPEAAEPAAAEPEPAAAPEPAGPEPEPAAAPEAEAAEPAAAEPATPPPAAEPPPEPATPPPAAEPAARRRKPRA